VESKTEAKTETKKKGKIELIYPSKEEVEKLAKILAGDRVGKFWVFMDWTSVLTDFYRMILNIDDPEELSVKLGRFLAIVPQHIRERIEARAEQYRQKLNFNGDDEDYTPSVFDDEEDYMHEIHEEKLTEIELENQIIIRAITDIFYDLNLIPQEIRPPTIDYTDFRKIFGGGSEEEEEEEIEVIE